MAYDDADLSRRRGMLIDFATAISVSGQPATGSANEEVVRCTVSLIYQCC